jgi:branched-chain amino acid transport system ATP-binding protein
MKYLIHQLEGEIKALMLKLVNVEVRFHESILVIRGVSLEVLQRQIVSLLGANGAGKTTILKAISGILSPDDGKVSDGFVEFEGRRIDKLEPYEIAEAGIIQVMEGRRIFEHLNAEENLLTGSIIHRDVSPKINLEKIYAYFPQLNSVRKRMAGYLSGGEQQMLVIGRALMGRPKLLILDEPSLGLAPALLKGIFGILKAINRGEGLSMLVVEQNANIALHFSDYGYVLENGRIVLDGPSEKIVENEDIKEFYLGLSELGSRKSYRDFKHYSRRKRWL